MNQMQARKKSSLTLNFPLPGLFRLHGACFLKYVDINYKETKIEWNNILSFSCNGYKKSMQFFSMIRVLLHLVNQGNNILVNNIISVTRKGDPNKVTSFSFLKAIDNL